MKEVHCKKKEKKNNIKLFHICIHSAYAESAIPLVHWLENSTKHFVAEKLINLYHH